MQPAYKDDPDAIVWAALDCDYDLVLSCLNQGVSPDTTDERGRTALHTASEQGWLHIVQLLLDRNATVDARDAEGDTPHDYAVFAGQTEVAALLAKRGATIRVGPSARQKLDDNIAEGFDSVNAARRLIDKIKQNKGK
jgi:ankyrin repeat protein